MMTSQYLQTLRNMGNEAEAAADEIERLREQLDRFTPLRAKGVVDADDNLDCWDIAPFGICHDHVTALNAKDPAAMWRVVDLFARDEAANLGPNVKLLVDRLRAAALPGTNRRALDEEAAAEIELLREMLEDLAKAVWLLDQGGFIGTNDDDSEAECDNLRRIARQTVDAYTGYRRPNV